MALATSTSIARASKKVGAEDEHQAEDEAVQLKKVYCIHYSICFQKNSVDIEALLNLGSEVNAMISAFISS